MLSRCMANYQCPTLPINTANTVLNIRPISLAMVLLSVYFKSIRIQSEKDTLRDFEICQMHVKPGFVSKRRRCHTLHFASSSQGSGRGPTIAIWPTKTFQSCGNSSMPVFRSSRPSLVTRGSFLILNAGPSRSFNCNQVDIQRANLFSTNAFRAIRQCVSDVQIANHGCRRRRAKRKATSIERARRSCVQD